MATATEVITSAFRRIGIKDSETPITAQEITDGIELLNDMMNQLEIEGFELGYTDVSAGGDTVTLSDTGYLNFVKLQLAARLGQENEVSLNEFLFADLQAARRSVVRDLNRKNLTGATVGSFAYMIYGAIELLGVKSAEEPINAEEMNNGISYLNDLINNLESEGWGFGYRVGTALTDDTGLPDWSYRWIKALLARELSSSYSVPTPSNVERMIMEGEDSAYTMSSKRIVTKFPETLPTGGADVYFEDDNFFGEDMSDELITDSLDVLTNSENDQLLKDE